MKGLGARRTAIAGAVAYAAGWAASAVAWMNPATAEFYASFEGHPACKGMDFLGGPGPWIGANYLFGAFYTVALMAVFLRVRPVLPGGAFLKGIAFGIALAVVRVLPESFNQWMLTTYPEPLILVQAINTAAQFLAVFSTFSVALSRMDPERAAGRARGREAPTRRPE